jgi:hypothetical protein
MYLTDIMRYVIPAAAVVAAIIAGLFALIGNLGDRSNAKLAAEISRKNAELNASLEAAKQLATNRQEWINGLREDMSYFMALATEKDNKNFDRLKVIQTRLRIELRLNPKDIDYERLRSSMAAVVKSTRDLPEDDNGMGAYIEVCQKILKREWDVLKGELQSIGQTNSETDSLW